MKIIDISEHQGKINFKKVKNDGIEGIIIRVGWIGNKNNHTLDKRFLEYYNEANRLGFKIGFYIYSYCKLIETLQEGTFWTLEQIKNKRCELGCYLDLEDNTIANLGTQLLTKQGIEFCKIMEDNNIIGGIYANLYWFNSKLNVNELIKYKIWLAQYTSSSNHSASFPVNIWQYSSQGSINGINTKVDMNILEKWNNLPDVTESPNETDKGGFEVKIYQNGSTKETVYQDKNCTKNIGYLNPYETAECYGIIDNKAVVVYNIDRTSNKKVGFVKWLRWCQKLMFLVEL